MSVCLSLSLSVYLVILMLNNKSTKKISLFVGMYVSYIDVTQHNIVRVYLRLNVKIYSFTLVGKPAAFTG